jgi:glycosyltransferase involved in cell wall biosynthesis
MAGPGIRYFEMAKSLSKSHQVILAAPEPVKLSEKVDFRILPYDKTRETRDLSPVIASFNVVIAQFLKPALLSKIQTAGVRYIADLYDPLIIETLEHFKNDPEKIQTINIEFQRQLTLLQVGYADLILVASEKQADYYYGLLSAAGRITASSYKEDPTFNRLLMVVPFGIEDSQGKIDRTLIKQIIPSYSTEDKIIIWAGGIWNWFDPLTVIKAVANVSKTDPRIKLLFMAGRHPNPDIPEMKMAAEALALSDKLELTGKQVFFATNWIPYADRHGLLDAASIGISTHFEDIETRFSFRTRILDYIGHRLPIIATRGDSMSELIESRELGVVVDYRDQKQIEQAILKLVDDQKFYTDCQKSLESARQDFLWSNLLEPLSTFITSNKFLKNQSLPKPELRLLTFNFYKTAAKRIQITKGLGGIFNKLIGR